MKKYSRARVMLWFACSFELFFSFSWPATFIELLPFNKGEHSQLKIFSQISRLKWLNINGLEVNGSQKSTITNLE